MEFVFVVPRNKVFRDCFPQGLVSFTREDERRQFDDLVREEGFYVQREHAERNPDLKQVIPYTVFWVKGEILVMRRLQAGGESRLHDKLSIGVGGHINPSDGTENPILAATRREIEEEIDVQGAYEIRSIGTLNDDSDPVGAVHLGLVQLAQLEGTLEIREKDVLEGRLVSPTTLRALRERGENFETWSSILIDRLDELVPQREPVAS